MTGEGVARTRILNGIESLLLPSSHRGGINLSGLDLTNESLDESLLKDLPSVLRWYLAFSEHPTEEQVGELLDNVRSLDLGHNLLSSTLLFLTTLEGCADAVYRYSKIPRKDTAKSRIAHTIA